MSKEQQSFDKEKFNKVCELPYKGQLIFFMNAFWNECKDDCEKIFKIFQKFLDLDKKKQEGTALDEHTSHILFEFFGQPLTVLEFREEFRKIDANFDKKMGIIEYLIFKYKVSIVELLKRPQGTNEALEAAQKELEKAQKEIERIETEKAKLEEESKLEGIKGLKAKNELAQLLSKDPTALNKMLIDATFQVKKAKKAECTAAMGALWIVEREIEEASKYKPKGNLSKEQPKKEEFKPQPKNLLTEIEKGKTLEKASVFTKKDDEKKEDEKPKEKKVWKRPEPEKK